MQLDIFKIQANLAALEDTGRGPPTRCQSPTWTLKPKSKADPEMAAPRQRIGKLKDVIRYYQDNRVDPTEPTWLAARRQLDSLSKRSKAPGRGARRDQEPSNNQGLDDIKLTRIQLPKTWPPWKKNKRNTRQRWFS